MKPYNPTEKDLLFFRNLIRLMRDGGMWTLPSAAMTYQFNKKEQILRLVSPAWDATPTTMLSHHHNHCILAKLGWKVLPEINWDLI